MTRKGQITLPAAFRRRHQIREGGRVLVTDDGDALIIRALPDVEELVGCFQGRFDQEELKRDLNRSRARWR